MSLPSKVQVGGVPYEVHPVRRLRDDEGVLGRCMCHLQYIELDQDLSTDAMAATLLHEVIHAILYQSGHDDHAEPQVRALGYGLLAFLRDNAEWIRGLL